MEVDMNAIINARVEKRMEEILHTGRMPDPEQQDSLRDRIAKEEREKLLEELEFERRSREAMERVSTDSSVQTPSKSVPYITDEELDEVERIVAEKTLEKRTDYFRSNEEQRKNNPYGILANDDGDIVDRKISKVIRQQLIEELQEKKAIIANRDKIRREYESGERTDAQKAREHDLAKKEYARKRNAYDRLEDLESDISDLQHSKRTELDAMMGEAERQREDMAATARQTEKGIHYNLDFINPAWTVMGYDLQACSANNELNHLIQDAMAKEHNIAKAKIALAELMAIKELGDNETWRSLVAGLSDKSTGMVNMSELVASLADAKVRTALGFMDAAEKNIDVSTSGVSKKIDLLNKANNIITERVKSRIEEIDNKYNSAQSGADSRRRELEQAIGLATIENATSGVSMADIEDNSKTIGMTKDVRTTERE